MTAPSTNGRASESTHWYWPTGLPAYEITGANGKLRATTLRDARRHGLYPSVTTIIRSAAAPGLEIWKQRQVLLAALTLPRVQDETDEGFIARILDDSKQQMRDAADLGTRIHTAVQQSYDLQTISHEYEGIVQTVRDAVRTHFGVQDFIAERSFAHPLGYGGKVDLHTETVVLDVKTKAFSTPKEISLYDEHLMQLAGYREGLGYSEARVGNVFVSTTVPDLVVVLEHSRPETERGWAMFRALLEYWQQKTQHRPVAA